MQKEAASWYRIANADQLDSPALLVYPDRIMHNINTAVAMVGDVQRLRPHVKTHKSTAVTTQQLAAGITRFKCATLAEAEMLGRCGAQDVLVAYPIVGPRLSAFLSLSSRYPETRFSVLIDHPDLVDVIAQAAVAKGTAVDVFIDLDIGMGRTGIPIGPAAEQLYKDCASWVGLRLRGLHAYDGQVREPDARLLRKQCEANYQPLADLVERLTAAGYAVPEIVIGGSPSFPYYAEKPMVQCSPGTFVLWDHGYLTDCPDQPFLPAAVLFCRVISLPGPETVCVDLGHKAVAAESAIDKRVFFLNAPLLHPIRQSEEHLVLQAPAGHSFKLGDVLYGVPYHVCPTVNLYDSYQVVENGRVVDSWEIDARQRPRWQLLGNQDYSH